MVNAGIGSPRCAAAKAEDDRGIEPAADVADDRHVAAEPALDGLLQQGLELVDQRRRVGRAGARGRRRGSRGPSTVLGDPAVPDLQEMPGRQRLDPSKKVRVVPAQKKVKRWSMPADVWPRGDHARGEQGLDLRAPEQPAVDLGVVERADADPVAAQDQGAAVPVPERDGELAARPCSNIPSPRSS